MTQRLLQIVTEVLQRPYPYVSGHMATGPEDTDITPHRLHPSFHGALDWHSSVHMQWSLVRLLNSEVTAPGSGRPRQQGYAVEPAMPSPSPQAVAARELLESRLTAQNVAVEVAYLRQRPAFERPYGWAWAALLAAEVRGEPTWAAALDPLATVIAEHVLAWLPRQAYPVRHGKHQNDAFALLLLRRAYRQLGRDDVVQAVTDRARHWFAGDGPADTSSEPSGTDFLSPALTEAVLMQDVLGKQFPAWLARFLPGLGEGQHAHLLEVPTVLDAADGQGAHLLGLALSRAWHLRALARALPATAGAALREAADRQVAAVRPQVTDGDFMATHWLVSFLLLADGEVPSRDLPAQHGAEL